MLYRFSVSRILRKLEDLVRNLPYFIEYNVRISIVHTFNLQFYLNTLFMNKVGESCLPRIVRTQYFSITLNEKKCALYSIKYGTLTYVVAELVPNI